MVEEFGAMKLIIRLVLDADDEGGKDMSTARKGSLWSKTHSEVEPTNIDSSETGHDLRQRRPLVKLECLVGSATDTSFRVSSRRKYIDIYAHV